MSNKPVLQTITICLAVAAAYVCLVLLQKHVTGSPAPGWFESACSADGALPGADCEEVLASPYAVFPFVKEDDPEGMPRVPVALHGLIYYSMLTVWLIGVGRPSFERRWLHGLLMFWSVCSLAGCGFFVLIMFSKTEAWCPWCLVTHCLNLVITILIFMMWPRKAAVISSAVATTSSEQAASDLEGSPAGQVPTPVSAQTESVRASARRDLAEQSVVDLRASARAEARSSGVGPDRPRSSCFPTTRQVVVTLLGMLLVAAAENQLYLRADLNKKYTDFYDKCTAKIEEFTGDGAKMVRNWQLEEVRKIELGDDPSLRGGVKGRKSLQCVVFSDFECPSCRKLAHFLEEKAQPLFDGGLKIIFKHYPLDKECNSKIKRAVHPHACKAAAFAETARLQGGNEAFWRAHDYFFTNRQRVKKLTIADFTSALGLDVERFKKDLESKAFARRIFDDITLAQELGLNSTPSVFILGKKVNSLAAKDMDFWDEMANMYWKIVKMPRPEKTKLEGKAAVKKQSKVAVEKQNNSAVKKRSDAPKSATPDSPDPKVAP